MKTRYRLTRRGSRGDTFYCVATQTRKRTSLNTSDLKVAQRIVEAKNWAEQQPARRSIANWPKPISVCRIQSEIGQYRRFTSIAARTSTMGAQPSS